MSKFKSYLQVIALVLIVCLMLNQRGAQAAGSPGTAFTYQGQLKDGSGNPITNSCNFQFGLYAAPSGGSLVTGTTLQTILGVAVANGYFTVSLDFGTGAFDGNARWLEIGVSCPAGGSYTTLSPRQALTATPYALYAVSAGTAASLSGVLPLANGGTGSATQNFVDLTTAQSLSGVKTFSSAPSFAAAGTPFNVTGSSLVTNLNADLLDGLHASAFQQHMQSVRVVAKSGGDYTTITGALNGITDASAANPYLIYVAPGVYTEQVTMKPYVDIQGAGELLTKITAAASMNASSGTVIGAGNAGLSFLTVESIGSPSLTYATAIYNTASVRLTHVTAIASGSPNSTGVENYAYLNTPNSSIDITMTDVTASASVDGPARAFGVYNYTYGTGPGNMMKVTMTNLNASASMAGFTMGVYNRIQNGKMEVTMSYVNATASGGAFGGDIYGVYNESSSPTMTVVSAIVTGGNHANHAYGVYNKTSTAAMTDVTATVSGDTNNYGIYNSLSSPTMSDVTAIASGGTNNYGVWNDSSSVTILDSVISASSGTSDGIHNAGTGAGPFTVMINNSRVVGGSSTIYTEVATYTTKVGASQLVGIGGQGFGTYKCVFTYNGNFDPLGAATCQ